MLLFIIILKLNNHLVVKQPLLVKFLEILFFKGMQDLLNNDEGFGMSGNFISIFDFYYSS